MDLYTLLYSKWITDKDTWNSAQCSVASWIGGEFGGEWIHIYFFLSPLRLVWSPCSPRDSPEFSPTPEFKSVNSSVFSLLYVQLSHVYMTTGKTIALTIWTFVGKVMSLLFNTLSRFVIAFLPRSKCLLISMPLLLYFSSWRLLTLGIRWSLYLFIVCLLFQKASSVRWGFFMPSL